MRARVKVRLGGSAVDSARVLEPPSVEGRRMRGQEPEVRISPSQAGVRGQTYPAPL